MSKRTDELFALAANPDKLPEALLGLKEEITTMETAASASAEKIPALEKQINELRETNMKLFLRQTQEVKEDHEETPEETFDRLFTKAVMPEENK